jgi:hypothetical protein
VISNQSSGSGEQRTGGTGDPLVPSGDSPLAMGGDPARFLARKISGALSIPSGRWPDGTGESPVLPEAWLRHPKRTVLFRVLVLLFAVCSSIAFAQSEVIVDFEKAEITGRWIDSWEENGVVFTPAHAPKLSKAKARLMFFPHIESGRKGILSAMATDPIPVRARFPKGASSVTLVLWGSTSCPARLAAFDLEGKLLDEKSLQTIPSRKSLGDPIPTFELTVKATNIAYIEFSGPRAGEFLAADELRFRPSVEGAK